HRIERKPQDHDFLTLIKQYEGRKPTVDVKADDIAIFQYTGGTTGGAKAAMSTHQALVSNVLQTCYWLGPDAGEKTLAGAIPFFHVYGMVAVLSAAAFLRASVLLVPNPRDIKEVLEVMDAYKPTLFHGVPAMFNAINNNPDMLAGKYNLRSIRACISGS